MTPPKPRLCGQFIPDPAIPADHNGRRACANCGLMGEPGDTRHTLPVVPEQAVVAARYDPEEAEG